MLYKNCRELPMHNFNEIEVTGDLTYLIKDKEEHEQLELEKHWVDILDERFENLKDNSQRKFFRDRAELMFLELKLKTLTCLRDLNEDQLSKDQLKTFKEITKKYRVTDVNQAILEVTDKINRKISQFNRQYNTEKSSNFENTLASMRMAGYHVNRHEITVSEFDALIDQIKKQNQSRNAKRQKK